MVMVENNGVPVIKDSGKQREFGTGAIRDFAEGKGRCDLLPLEEVAELLPSDTIKHLAQLSKEPTNVNHIYVALRSFADEIKLPLETLMIEASKQYEGGAQKYGENNWKNGMPCWVFLDCGVRHYLKWRRGDNDEPHDRAFLWNMLGLAWTIKNLPELNTLGKAYQKAEK